MSNKFESRVHHRLCIVVLFLAVCILLQGLCKTPMRTSSSMFGFPDRRYPCTIVLFPGVRSFLLAPSRFPKCMTTSKFESQGFRSCSSIVVLFLEGCTLRWGRNILPRCTCKNTIVCLGFRSLWCKTVSSKAGCSFLPGLRNPPKCMMTSMF